MSLETGSRPIKLRNYLAYGAGDLYGGGAFFIVTTYMLYYLINVVGLNPFLAGAIPMIGKAWDAINDPLMGYIADRTPENRFGRRRVWFLISVLPIAVTFTLIWFPLSVSSQGWKFFYYTMAYLMFFSVTTMSYVPYAALSAEMTRDSKERNKLNGFRILFAFISTLIAGVSIDPILNLFGGGKWGYFVMGIIFSLLFSLPWITLYFGTWEMPEITKRGENNGRFFSNFFSLFKNRSCRIHIMMYVCAYGTLDILMTLIKFYFNDYLKMGSIFFIAQGVLLLTMIAMLAVYVWVSNKKGHAVAYKIGLSLVIVGICLMAFQSPDSHPAFLLANIFLIGAGLAAGNLIPHQLLPFVVDVDRLITRKERPGTYSAAMTLTRKMVLAFVVVWGVTSMMSIIGYQQALPSILPKEHYENIELQLSQSDVAESALMSELYVELGEGEQSYYYLNSFKEKPAKWVVDMLKSVKEDPSAARILTSLKENKKDAAKQNDILSAIDINLFATALDTKFDQKNPKEIYKRWLLSQVYLENDGMMVLDNAKLTSMLPDEKKLYKMRKVFSDIGIKYTGIASVKVVQQESTVKRLKWMFILFPLVGLTLGLIAASFFKLTPENHQIVLAEMDRLDAGGKREEVEPNVKAVCEKLTGYKYENLYPDESESV